MPPISFSLLSQLRLIWSFDGQLGINVFNAITPAGTVINQALADRVGSAFKTLYTSGTLRPFQATTTVLENVGVRDMRLASQAEFLDSGAGVAGTGVGDPLPRQVALVVTLRTAQAGRSFRGRTYIGGATEAINVATAEATQAYADAARDFVANLGSTMFTENLQMAIFSRPRNAKTTTTVETLPDGTTHTSTHLTSESAGALTAVTTVLVRDLQWDTQRRRNNGRGSLVAATLRGVSSVNL